MLSRKQKKLAENFLSRVEKYIESNTNPNLVKEILKNIGLSEFAPKDTYFTDFLEKITINPINLRPFIDKLKRELLDNVGFCSILAEIEKKALISDNELENASPTLNLQMNLLFVMESFVVTMANSSSLPEEMYQHVRNRRQNSFLPGHPITTFMFGTPKDATFFEKIKIISVDPPMLPIVFHRSMQNRIEEQADADNFVKKYDLRSINVCIDVAKKDLEYTGPISGMGVNIAEASQADKNRDNAIAGLGLNALMEKKRDEFNSKYTVRSTVLPSGVSTSGDNNHEYPLIPGLKIDSRDKLVSVFNVNQAWRDLYNTWNCCFVVNNIDSVFLPLKLLLPSVLAIDPCMFKETRTISLFLFANIYLNEQTGKNPFFAANFKFQNSEEILSAWATINKNYANQILKQYFPNESLDMDKLFENIFGQYPFLNLMKIIGSVVAYGDNYHIIPDELWKLIPDELCKPTSSSSNNERLSQSNYGIFSPKPAENNEIAGENEVNENKCSMQ